MSLFFDNSPEWHISHYHLQILLVLLLIYLFLCWHVLTSPHSAPSWVAMMVAARGVLYMSASSPKLPLLSYWPTHVPNTAMSYTPLEKGGEERQLAKETRENRTAK